MSDRNIYIRNGFSSRRDYLESLSEDFGIELSNVLAAAELLGPNEDFDGLPATLEDFDYLFNSL
jgi:hypothetical protein